MRFELQTRPEHLEAFKRGGLWPNRLLSEYFDDNLAAAPDQPAIIGYESQAGTRVQHSHASLDRAVERIALSLIEIGIAPGDVVSAQLPNYWQLGALYLACVRIGAVLNPLMPIFRQRELSFMLPFAEAKAMFVASRHRGYDYPDMIAGLRPELPGLSHVFVIDGPNFDGLEAQLSPSTRTPAAEFAARKPSPNDISLLMYTSGTTGKPKLAMLSHRNLIAMAKSFQEIDPVSADNAFLSLLPLPWMGEQMLAISMSLLVGFAVNFP